MEKLKELLDHKQKRVQIVAAKLLESDGRVRLSKAGEIEAAFKIRGILGKNSCKINRLDYSSDHMVTIL